jgi:hypothetical protein
MNFFCPLKTGREAKRFRPVNAVRVNSIPVWLRLAMIRENPVFHLKRSEGQIIQRY